MADLTITAADVSPVRIDEAYTWPIASGETIVKGNYARCDASTGKATGGNGTAAGEVGFGGVCFSDDGAQARRIMRKGLLDVGEALAGLNFGAKVYLSDTDKTLADANGTVTVLIGHVAPSFGATTADRLLAVDVED
jgi:hypothetical protein